MQFQNLIVIAVSLALSVGGAAQAGDNPIRARCAAIGSQAAQNPGASAATTTVITGNAGRAAVAGHHPVIIRSTGGGRVGPVPVVHYHPHFHGGGGGIAGLIAGVVITAAIGAAVAEDARQKAEHDCLVSHGLIAPPKPAAAFHGAPQGGKCACPQMHTCSGSWVTMTCHQLVTLCQTASTKPIVYMKNGCDKLKTLVSF